MARHDARRWLLAAAVLAAGVATPAHGAAAPELESLVAARLAAALRSSGVPAKVTGRTDVVIEGADLRLHVRDAREPGDEADEVHVHVVARVPGAAPRGLDACAVGMGSTAEARVAAAAESYVARAFPPIYALVREEAATTALRFGGTEPFAVPGFRGLAGPLAILGDADADAVEQALARGRPFEGLRLPDDGRVHLLKAVLLGKDRTWSRSLELDGEPTAVTDAPWRGVPAPPGTAMVVRFAVFRGRDAFARTEARAAALARLAKREPWLFDGATCPLDVAPKTLFAPPFNSESCSGGRLLDCLEECKAGAGASCYAAAVEVERKADADRASQALHVRACRLGIASGCTNAAAGLEPTRRKKGGLAAKDACPERTFEAVCERSRDPWACTMFGDALARGDHVRRDVRRARSVLAHGCAFGEEDPACRAARSILERLDGAAPSR